MGVGAPENPWAEWVGLREDRTETALPGPSEALAALLDHETPPWRPGELPPLAHWFQFLPRTRQSELGDDGHARRGGFLPPIPLARRMWAGGRLSFHAAIPFGAQISRVSTIQSVEPKRGKAGDLVFVTVVHEITCEGELAIREEQDIVYLDPPPGPVATPAPEPPREADWSREVTPGAVTLFRYSALTFNGHRIHYDADYTRTVEGYPGLVVHGPLQATLLLDHFLRRRPQARIASFEFRARAPAFADRPLRLGGSGEGRSARLFSQAVDGPVCMQANIVEG